ncbi:MAG: PD40 domain-containing protein, partial [Acidobacteriota bacterium]
DLLFASERAGGRDLFRVKISDGQQDGEPVIVSKDFTSDWVLGLSRAGALFYAETDRRHRSYRTEIDLETGKAIGDPKPVGGAVLEGVLSPVWSPDGKSTAFVRMRPSPGVSTLVIRDEKGEDRELFSSMEFLRRSALRWDKEGQPLLVWGRGREKTGIFRIDQHSGESSLLLEGDYFGMGDWSSDGRYVYYRGTPDQCGILRRDTRSGEEETLHVAESSVRPLRLSRKGDLLFFSEKENADDPGQRRMLILSVENGETQRLGKLDQDLYLGFTSSQVVWAPDGKRIYLAVRRRSGSKGRRFEIAFTDIAEGDLGRTGLTSSDSITHLAIHPDGRQLAWTVSTRVDTPWVMEDFLNDD